MADAARDVFITGLRNAHAMEIHAMEIQARELMERQSERLGDHPEVQSLAANTMATAHAMAADEILKNTFANNALEHYEIAAYKSLIAMCANAGAESARAGEDRAGGARECPSRRPAPIL
jgi:ferritin-like metal-binding protein YciE